MKFAVDLGRRGRLLTPGDLEAEKPSPIKGALRKMAGADKGRTPLSVAPGSPPAGTRGTVAAIFRVSPDAMHSQLIGEMTDETKRQFTHALLQAAQREEVTLRAALGGAQRVKADLEGENQSKAALGEPERRAAVFSEVKQLSAAVRDVEKLTTTLGTDDLSRVRVKPMKNIMSLRLEKGGQHLLTAVNTKGEQVEYHWVPDPKGYLAKIVVAPHVEALEESALGGTSFPAADTPSPLVPRYPRPTTPPVG